MCYCECYHFPLHVTKVCHNKSHHFILHEITKVCKNKSYHFLILFIWVALELHFKFKSNCQYAFKFALGQKLLSFPISTLHNSEIYENDGPQWFPQLHAIYRNFQRTLKLLAPTKQLDLRKLRMLVSPTPNAGKYGWPKNCWLYCKKERLLIKNGTLCATKDANLNNERNLFLWRKFMIHPLCCTITNLTCSFPLCFLFMIL